MEEPALPLVMTHQCHHCLRQQHGLQVGVLPQVIHQVDLHPSPAPLHNHHVW